MTQPTFAEAMALLSELDLGTLQAEIEAKESELAALREFHRAVDVLQNGRKPRKKRLQQTIEPEDDPPAAVQTTRKPGRKPKAQRILEVLQSHRLISAKRIAEILQLSESDVLYVLNNGFETTTFDMDQDGKWFIA